MVASVGCESWDTAVLGVVTKKREGVRWINDKYECKMYRIRGKPTARFLSLVLTAKVILILDCCFAGWGVRLEATFDI